MKKTIKIVVVLLCAFLVYNCSEKDDPPPTGGCESSYGTITLENQKSQSIKVLLDNINYGFVSPGNTISIEVVANISHSLFTEYSNGSTACSSSNVSVGACATNSLVCR